MASLLAKMTLEEKVGQMTQVDLQPGAGKTVTFNLNTDDLAFIGLDNKPVVERGQFKVTIADLSKTFEIR